MIKHHLHLNTALHIVAKQQLQEKKSKNKKICTAKNTENAKDMARLFGYGIGVIIVSTIWTISILLCLAFSRRKGLQSGFIYLVMAAIIHGILYIWPKQSCDPLPRIIANQQEIDHLGIPRIIFALFLMILAIYAIFRFIFIQLFTPIRTKRVQEKIN